MQDTLCSSTGRRRGRRPSAKRSFLEGRNRSMGQDKAVVVHRQCLEQSTNRNNIVVAAKVLAARLGRRGRRGSIGRGRGAAGHNISGGFRGILR